MLKKKISYTLAAAVAFTALGFAPAQADLWEEGDELNPQAVLAINGQGAVAKTTVKPGKKVKFTLRMVQVHPDAKVKLQRKVGKGKWKAIATIKPDRDLVTNYSKKVKIKKKSAFRVKIFKHKGHHPKKVSNKIVVKVNNSNELAKMQKDILKETNKYRKKHGLKPLKAMKPIHKVAQKWSNKMRNRNKLAHNPHYSKQIPKGWTRAAENVAAGYTSAEAVVKAWYQSKGHRKNMLGNYSHIGIGFAKGDVGYRTYYTQNFAKY